MINLLGTDLRILVVLITYQIAFRLLGCKQGCTAVDDVQLLMDNLLEAYQLLILFEILLGLSLATKGIE